MAKKSRRSPNTSNSSGSASTPDSITPGVFDVDQGTAEIKPDPFTPGAWLLLLNGAESSQLHPAAPEVLGFEYMRWMAHVIEHRFAPKTSQRLRMLHLGGAGCNMARWAAHRYPGAHQTAIENDARLAELARTNFGLPRAPQLKIRVADALQILSTTPDERWEVIIRDVFYQPEPDTEHITPFELATVEAAQHAARALSPDGLYITNYGGPPDLSPARAEAASLAEAFKHVVLVADPAMFKGRRRGNIVMVGSHRPLIQDGPLEALRRVLRNEMIPTHLKAGREVTDFIAGAAPNRAGRPQ